MAEKKNGIARTAMNWQHRNDKHFWLKITSWMPVKIHRKPVCNLNWICRFGFLNWNMFKYYQLTFLALSTSRCFSCCCAFSLYHSVCLVLVYCQTPSFCLEKCTLKIPNRSQMYTHTHTSIHTRSNLRCDKLNH